LTGAETARRILQSEGLSEISVQKVEGTLTDHYHPKKRQLFLSEPVYGANSISALGVAAHETGHALQHQSGYVPLQLRSAFVPVASIGSNAALPLFLIGFFFANTLGWLMDVGIIFFCAAVLFHLVTLPVEFNASSRAIAILQGRGYLQGHEVGAAKQVLNAAAWTYVAAATMSLMQLVRLLILRSSRD
jgi:Zn-dependent membrane protease YugP